MHGILVVDDSLFMRQLYRKLLNRHNFPVVGEAANGFEAIVQYEQLSPALVIMDINMPGMLGTQALDEILRIDKNANIIIASALGQEHFVRQAIASGARAFLVKPIVEHIFISTVSKLYNTQH